MAVVVPIRKEQPTVSDLIGMDVHEYMAEVERLEAYRWDAEIARGLKAMRLAPSLAVCRALLAGQPVPESQLDPAWRRRYGL